MALNQFMLQDFQTASEVLINYLINTEQTIRAEPETGLMKGLLYKHITHITHSSLLI